MSSFVRCGTFDALGNSHGLHEETFINLNASHTLMEYPSTTDNLHLCRCMMTPPASREIPVGGTGRPLAISTALFGMTLFLIYLIILFPRPFLFTYDRTIVEVLPPTIMLSSTASPTTQAKPEAVNLYKNLNDTYSRTQIPLFNLPYLYKVRIKLFMPWKKGLDYGHLNWTTEGHSIMYFTVQRTNQRLQVHALNLHIGDVQIYDDFGRNITITEISRAYPQVLDIHTEHELIENMNYSLHIHYRGGVVHGKEKVGLQSSGYKDGQQFKHMVSTHCQTQYARVILPCLDVPEAKATFVFTLTHPEGTNAVSNAREISRSFDGEWTTTKFEESPHMSTYLLAFAVSDFPFIETTYKDVKIRIFAEKSKIENAQLALETVPLVIEQLENYFTIPIPLKKLDIYEVPQLNVAAMENWGLITTQPKGLLYNKNTSSAADKSGVVHVLSHEIAHQWFGNMVTMKWWNNLWLNEGFATMLGTKIAVKLGREHQYNYLPLLAVVLRREQDIPTALSPPETPTFPLKDMFQNAYHKPALVMEMIEKIVGEESFRLGVVRFLKRHAYSNADHEHLMEALSYAYDSSFGIQPAGQSFSLGSVLDQWICNKGYPIITVKSREDGMVVASQSSAYRGPAKEITKQQWTIPLFLKDPITKEAKVEWLQINKTLVIDLGEDVILDAEANTFVRVWYDTPMYEKIARTLRDNHEIIPMRSRGRLLDDSFTAAEKGVIPYKSVFSLVNYLANETIYGPVAIFSAHLDFLNGRLNVHEKYYLLKNYIAAVLGPIFLRHLNIGHERRTDGDEHLFDVVCRRTCAAGFLPCVTEAKEVIANLMEVCGSNELSSSCNSLPKYVRRCYYIAAVAYGEQDAFDFFYDHYTIESDADEKFYQWNALVASQIKNNVWKAWDRLLFHDLKEMTTGRFHHYCGEYSKYYPADDYYFTFFTENAEKIIRELNLGEMQYLLMTLIRTFYHSSQQAKYDQIATIVRKSHPLIKIYAWSRVEQVEHFRNHYADTIFAALVQELEILETQPMIQ